MTKDSQSNNLDEYLDIFFPHTQECLSRIITSKTNFVHYTTAEAAMNIIRSKRVWFRQPYLMNDYNELHYGLDCLISIYDDKTLNLKSILNNYHKDITGEIEKDFNSLIEVNRNNIYVFCMSEHDENENNTGRLSMWRAYGKQTGVAIVLKHDSILTPSPGTKSIIAPVAYKNKNDFKFYFEKIFENIKKNDDIIKTLDRETFKNIIVQMFRIAVLTTKHEGFAEEREWRIIYSPSVDESNVMMNEIETINGIPQEVCKLELKNNELIGLNKISPNDVLDRLIVGPTNYPFPIYKAFVKLIGDADVEVPQSKVHISDIPLRL